MLWHLQIDPAPGQVDLAGRRVAADATELGLPGPWNVSASRGFLIEGAVDRSAVEQAARSVLVDPVVESFSIRLASESGGSVGAGTLIHVLPKPGVTDPEAESALALLRDLGLAVDNVRTIRTYRVEGPGESLPRLIGRVLANDAVEQAVVGPLPFDKLGQGTSYRFARVEVPILGKPDAELLDISRKGQLHFSLAEFRAVESHFAALGREPTDAELETLAQTWSEHCSHKTLRGRIEFEGEVIDNLLKRTIFGATQEMAADWLVSVFADNAGVVRFDDDFDVCFKVETHNHPSAIDPYGGANTGLGGVIRDPMGTGLGAKPICNTDVFCVAPPDTPVEGLPAGVLHPRRILKGVVAGVRDYGNRMGIPTVNGALVGHPAYLANPLVFCGTVGLIPRGMSTKSVEPGDRIVAVGGRTGRDGIHGATFSSVELTGESESISGGAVQIGNAITEKMVLDVVLQARDRGLFRSITDCGAGGFSSAVGEMGAEVGAEVELDRAPLKYEGLSYTEIWISEAQERMVLAVPPEHWPALRDLCESEGVEATDLGRFVDTGRLTLKYQGEVVGDLSMDFLHEGRPAVVRQASYTPIDPRPIDLPSETDYTADLLEILGTWDVCSKEWIVRQYDHEVQARTVIKPLVGVLDDGPGDASVVLPVVGSTRGLAISCGINPRFGLIDPEAMAGCVIDEAVRNCVAVGADPDRIAILDNFCWGNTERPETLGSLVMAARGCRDVALAYGTPFISGKDSLYNEYTHEGKSLAIPPTLLISAMGQVPDVRKCVTMDLKEAGNVLLLIGTTRDELGGSHWAMVRGLEGGQVPRVDKSAARPTFRAVHEAINRGLVRSCHDLSEGGLAVALAEMAIAGGLGVEAKIAEIPCPSGDLAPISLLFSESPTRFLLEVRPEALDEVLILFDGRAIHQVGIVIDDPRLTIRDGSSTLIDVPVSGLKDAWQAPLRW
ncbi:phosphoribosylformylglycinamidine synthase subunit PurL [Tundrisphaera lichenicola]|uniref:phosphoribosylformylglycinamidine synthase subunit PurL n=1 Tax=Tundrisphaera lichenicola TaxID=2029860 RepID=UPI003EB6C28E